MVVRSSGSRPDPRILLPIGDAAEPLTTPRALLLVLHCRRVECQRGFLICARCYRGHRYCCRECAAVARAASIAKARREYVPSDDVIERRRERARQAYRDRVLFRTDHTSKIHAKRPRVSPARRPPAIDRPSAPRAEDPHVDRPTLCAGSAELRVSLRDDSIERASRCRFCGRPGYPTRFDRARRLRN